MEAADEKTSEEEAISEKNEKKAARKIRKLQFLWSAYSPRFWWWEVVDMTRKMLMVGIPFLLQDRVLEGVMGVALCSFSVVLRVRTKGTF